MVTVNWLIKSFFNSCQTNPSQGGQFCGITPLEEGVAPARGPTIFEARLYEVPLPPGTGLWPHNM